MAIKETFYCLLLGTCKAISNCLSHVLIYNFFLVLARDSSIFFFILLKCIKSSRNYFYSIYFFSMFFFFRLPFLSEFRQSEKKLFFWNYVFLDFSGLLALIFSMRYRTRHRFLSLRRQSLLPLPHNQ